MSNLIYAGAGYVLGTRAGRARYDQIVRVARRVAGSQTVQSTAGLAQARFDQFAAHARQAVFAKLSGRQPEEPSAGVDGRAESQVLVELCEVEAVGAGCEAGGRSLLSRRSGGYVLEVDPGNVDVLRFCAVVASARHAGSPAEQARLLKEGLSWWQDPPLAHMPGEWAAQVRAELEHRHLDALLSWSRATMLVPDADLGPVVR